MYRSGPARRRRLKKMKRKAQDEINTASSVEDVEKGNVAKRSKDYAIDHGSNSAKSVTNRYSNDRIEPMRTSSVQSKRIADLNELIVDSIGQSFMEANTSIQLDQQQEHFDHKTYPRDQQIQSQRSSTTVNSIKKSTSFVDSNRDNLSPKAVPPQYLPKATVVMSRQQLATVQHAPEKTTLATSPENHTGLQYVLKSTIPPSPEKMPSLHYVSKATTDSLPRKLPPLHYVPKITPMSSTEKLATLHYAQKTIPTSPPDPLASINYVPKATTKSSRKISASINYVPKTMGTSFADTSTTLHYVPKASSVSSPRVHGVRVSKNSLTISSKPLASIPSESIDPAAHSHGLSDNVNSVPNQTSSVQTPCTIVVNTQSSSTKPTYYTSPSKRKHDHTDGQQRDSGFNQASITTPIDDSDVSVTHHKNNQVCAIDGVTVTPLRKKRLMK